MAAMNVNGVDQEAVSIASQTAGLALDGADATGVAQPAGGSGIRGWLSGIFSRLPGFGTAGAASPNVVTVQGVAGGTPQPVTLPAGTAIGLSAALVRNTSATAAAMTAGGTYQPPGLDTGVAAGSPAPYAAYRATLNPGQAGTLQFLWSNDNTTFKPAGAAIPVLAGQFTTLSTPIYGRYVTFVFTNGATAATAATAIIEQLSIA